MRWPPRDKKQALRALQDISHTLCALEGKRPTELAVADLITALDAILVLLKPRRRRARPRRR